VRQCPDCAGGGVLTPRNGKCRNCYGSGKVGTIADDIAGGKRPCPVCHGTGLCQTCGGKGLVASSAPSPARPHANAELNPFDDKVAIRLAYPKCGDVDWFEWRFLGRLKDPVCGHAWYAGSGLYALMQIRAAFGAGKRFAKYMTSGISGELAWLARGMGWFVGTILGIGIRLEFGVLMIPVQAIAGLCQPKKVRSEVVSRSIVIGVSAIAAGIGIFAIHSTSGDASPIQSALARELIGAWSDGIATVHFMQDGTVDEMSVKGTIPGRYVISGSDIIFKFSNVTTTEHVLSSNGGVIKYLITKRLGTDGVDYTRATDSTMVRSMVKRP